MFQIVMQIAGMAQRDKLEAAGGPLVAVAIDKDKSSQSAFKWTLDNLVQKGQTLTLIHVNTKASCKSLFYLSQLLLEQVIHLK